MAERVLILGTTGVEKKEALSRLGRYIDSQGMSVPYKEVNFEDDYLKSVLDENDKDLFSFLDDTNLRQRQLWLEAWRRFIPDKDKFHRQYRNQHIILSIHGVLTREFTGTRSAIDIKSIIEFAPTKIITLIDNVYLIWQRTQARAKGERKRGQPTIEQLLDARRSEIFIGDFIAGHQKTRPRHFILSVHHPARTLYRLLFVSKDIRTVYLSFPISGPRRLLNSGDTIGILEINEFLKVANTFELMNQKVACFCPLTIDELPLINGIDKEQDDEDNIIIDFSLEEKKWNIREFWKDEILLCADCPSVISLPLKQIREALGLIKSDVRLRDYRLVRQSKYLVVFNPWFDGKETSGVRNEISMAVIRGKSVYIYQDPNRDKNGDARKTLVPKEGSLGIDPTAFPVKFYDSIQGALQQVLA